MFCLNSDVVRWKSSKQEIVVDSTTEVEILLHLMQLRRLFGSRSSLLNLTLFLTLQTQWTSIVITMEHLHKLRNLDLTKDPNIYFDATISSMRSLIEEM